MGFHFIGKALYLHSFHTIVACIKWFLTMENGSGRRFMLFCWSGRTTKLTISPNFDQFEPKTSKITSHFPMSNLRILARH